MIGLVIVSHSAELAEGVRQLAEQMTQGKVPIATAGGIDNPENPIGTDPFKVKAAIESVYSPEGVVMLMDLGSALLSTEAALEFIPAEWRRSIHLCPAPLVEGAIVAAVQIMTGSPIEAVVEEAQNALMAKVMQLRGVADVSSMAAPEQAQAGAGQEVMLKVTNRLGLHARPAALFVSTAGRYKAKVLVRNVTRGSAWVSAKSINQVATLGVLQWHEIALSAEGEDAALALDALSALVRNNFGESAQEAAALQTETRVPVLSLKAGQLGGIPVAPGVALGPAYVYHMQTLTVIQRSITDPEAEIQRLMAAIAAARKDIELLRTRAQQQAGAYEAAIFDAHLLFLEDPALVDVAITRIRSERINAEVAWQTAVKTQVADFQALDDPYLQSRAVDVANVGEQVLRYLVGETRGALPVMDVPGILVAQDLMPSDTIQLDTAKVLGIATVMGGATSHAAILARALNIPAVAGLGPELMRIQPGTVLVVDGDQGLVEVAPDADAQAQYAQRRAQWLAKLADAKSRGQAPAITRDGKRVEVVANIRGLADARRALEYGAEGVGLLRTEFLYLDRKSAPSEEEQFVLYKAIADVFEQRPLVIRTLDIGGDKPLPYIDAPHEDNPFLGWRGIRMTLDRRDLLRTQLRAILRASPGRNIKVMAPMVATVEEARAFRSVVRAVQAELRAEGVPFDETMETGIMVEVPSAAVIADRLAQEVDFFSIGTNDLSQYTMAADRTNAQVAHLADPFHPAVLRLIKQVIDGAHAHGIWVGLCGELAGMPLGVPILLGLGLDEFSMNPPAIPGAKDIIRKLSLTEAQDVAAQALQLESAEAVKAYVASLNLAQVW